MTFLPYPSFEASAAVLDRARLGKQRVEALQLLLALTGRRSGWRDHPCARMWAGHEAALASYALAICAEWSNRGYQDKVALTVVAVVKQDRLDLVNAVRPPWLGDARLHSSHRSNLLRKNFSLYGLAGWPESPDQRYFWPPEALRKLPTLPRRAITMETITEAAPAAPTTPTPAPHQAELDTIKAACAKVLADANPAVSEGNLKRLTTRLAIVERYATSAITRLQKQTAYVTRVRRVKKVKPAPVAAAATA